METWSEQRMKVVENSDKKNIKKIR